MGLPTNIDFLLTCAQHPTFRAGTVDTGFIDEYALTLPNGTQNDVSAGVRQRDSLNVAFLFCASFNSLCRYLEDLLPDTAAPTPNDALALAGLSFTLQQETNVAAAHGNGGADVGSPWNDMALSGFRIARPTSTTVTIMDGDVPTQVRFWPQITCRECASREAPIRCTTNTAPRVEFTFWNFLMSACRVFACEGCREPAQPPGPAGF